MTLGEYVSVYPDGKPGHGDKETSLEAAESIQSIAGKLQKKVLTFISDNEEFGATVNEIMVVTGLIKDSCAPRVTELRKLGMIEDSGERRKTPSGRNAKVWVVVESGRMK